MSSPDSVTSINARKDFDREMKQVVSDAYQEVTELKAERAGVNERLSAVFNALEAKGFSKKGIKAGFAYLDTDDPQRLNFDNSYIFARIAGGVPLQNDLFEASMTASFLKLDDEGQDEDEAA